MAPASPWTTWRVLARLPSGAVLVPGAASDEQPGCPGPTAWGSCPLALAGVPPVCLGAEWFYSGGRSELAWTYRVETESLACPGAYLDPLGPLPIPGD